MTIWRHSIVAACLLFVCAGAAAAVHVEAASLDFAGVSMRDVSMELAPGADGLPRLQLKARVSVPVLGWDGVAMTLDGQPRTTAARAWEFTGHVTTRQAPGGALRDADLAVVFDRATGTLDIDVQQGSSALHALMPMDQPTHVQMTLAALPLSWLRGVLATAWPGGRLTAGNLSGDVALDLSADSTRMSGRVRLADAGFDSKAGDIAARGLGASGNFHLTVRPASTDARFDGALAGGQLLLGPLYAELPNHAANLHLAARVRPGGIAITSLDYDDHDALRVSGSLDFGRDGGVDKLVLTRFAATFPAAYDRYGSALVKSVTGLDGLDTSGGVVGSFTVGPQGPQVLDLELHNVGVDSHGGGLGITGLDGAVDWRAGSSRPATSLSWQGLAVYHLPIGPARLTLQDKDGTLALGTPVSMGLLGGSFALNRFAWRPDASSGQQLSAALALTGVDLPELCKAFGWPEFGGTLGGAVPELSYRNGNLVFGGGLSLQVFQGSVSITNLSVQHLFGAVPQVAADIALQQLDLAELTTAFDFGQITGRLDGTIDGLRLVSWKPVAFQATLSADDGGKISQHAIKSLTRVGGGGIAGGLQGIALRLFKTFNYARIGLSCTLSGGVCTMAGITPDPDPEGDGYTIVEGRGLPHITVIGHQHDVDWVTLIDRLKAATSGTGPVVE